VQLLDVAQGIGGFALDGEAEGDWSGWSVSAAGDVNGDGVADVLVGARRGDPNGIYDAGRTYVVFGKADTDKVTLADVAGGAGGFVLDGEGMMAMSGHSVSGAGDVNGDGLADVVVGAPGAGGLTAEGRAYVVFGKEGTARVSLVDVMSGLGGFAMDGEDQLHGAGSSVSGAGDVNGDGRPDVVVGAPGGDRAYVVFGKADTDRLALADVAAGVGGFVLNGEALGGRTGGAVSGAGDVNADGLADVIVGAPNVHANGTGSGRSYVVFGKQDTDQVSLADVTQGIAGFALDGETSYDAAGRSVSGAGDVNGDGLADVIVGASGADANGYFSGRAYVVFGKADTEQVSLADVTQGIGGFAMDGEEGENEAGWSVSGAGDVNGDGLADVVVGAYGVQPSGSAAGRTYVVFGKADTERVALVDVAQGLGGFVVDGEGVQDQSGSSVSGAGDVNGDGIADLVVGAHRADPNGLEDSGRTYVVFGGDFSCRGGG
jgi:hypothetical protein